MLIQSISRNALLLGLFAVITTGIVAATYLGTRSDIQNNIRRAEASALLEIIPKSRHDNSMLDDTQLVDDSQLLGLHETKKMYFARHHGELVAVIVPATARDGYTGDIDLIIGVNKDGSVAGVRVLAHRETPGLGDKVDHKKSNWLDGFIGKSLLNPTPERWKVKKDKGVFDQFTGATITPRAVTKTVKQALEFVAAHHDQWWPKQNQQATTAQGEIKHG